MAAHPQKGELVFEIKTGFPISHVSFSQRRYIGFRNRFEFDKKRLLVASQNEISIVGYDQLERPYQLYKG